MKLLLGRGVGLGGGGGGGEKRVLSWCCLFFEGGWERVGVFWGAVWGGYSLLGYALIIT